MTTICGNQRCSCCLYLSTSVPDTSLSLIAARSSGSPSHASRGETCAAESVQIGLESPPFLSACRGQARLRHWSFRYQKNYASSHARNPTSSTLVRLTDVDPLAGQWGSFGSKRCSRFGLAALPAYRHTYACMAFMSVHVRAAYIHITMYACIHTCVHT